MFAYYYRVFVFFETGEQLLSRAVNNGFTETRSSFTVNDRSRWPHGTLAICRKLKTVWATASEAISRRGKQSTNTVGKTANSNVFTDCIDTYKYEYSKF